MIKLLTFVFSFFFIITSAYSQSYNEKPIEFVISNGVGGGFDLYGRIFAKYYREYLPGNPEIVIKNIPGASGMNGIRYTLEKNVTDGTHINLVQPAPFLWSVIGSAKNIDANRIEWIGSLARDVWIVIVDSKLIREWSDISSPNVFVGVTNITDDGAITARILARVLNRNINLVAGYKTNPDALLALERGEIHMTPGHTYSTTINKKPEWFKRDSRYKAILVETSFTSRELLPNVPIISDITKDQELLQIINFITSRYNLGRPIWTNSGTSEETLLKLRTAFDKTVQDPNYIEELEKRNLENSPDSNKYLREVIRKMHSTPSHIIDQARPIILGE